MSAHDPVVSPAGRPSLRTSSPPADQGINLTPLLDIIFILIFFFLLATDIRRDIPTVDVQLPTLQARSEAAGSEDTRSVTVVVTREGLIHVSGAEGVVPVESLEALLNERRRNGAANLLVRIDGAARAGLMLDVMRRCQSAGFSSLAFEYTSGSPGGAP
jgi:biopolymer transport protein ExbD